MAATLVCVRQLNLDRPKCRVNTYDLLLEPKKHLLRFSTWHAIELLLVHLSVKI